MPFDRPDDLLAGFIAVSPSNEVPELIMAGEQWAPRDKRIAEHSHDVWEFYLQVSGSSVWRTGRRRHVLNPGGLLVAPPGVNHALPGEQPSDHHYFFAAVDLPIITQRLGAEVADAFESGAVQTRAQAGEARAAFQTLVREITILRPWRSIALRLAVDALVLEIARSLSGGQSEPVGLHPAVHRAVRLIEQEPERGWKTPTLARLAGVSPPHLNDLFRRELGTTPHAYIIRTRLERAAELLRAGGWQITRLAHNLGFCSSQHFTSAFKQHFGLTPRAFSAKK